MAKSNAERQRAFRVAQQRKKETREAELRSALQRVGEKTVRELGTEIALMAEKWGDDHLSVKDRVLILANRFGVV